MININTSIMREWLKLEKKPFPHYLKKANDINFIDFKRKFNQPKQVKEIIKKLYNGEIFLIRNTIDKKYINELKKNIIKLGKKEKSTFNKMIEGCPNFNRKITENNSKLYSVNSFRRVFYFFRWNKDPYRIFKKMDKIWDFVKYINGYKKNAFKENTPKDRIIDRIQVTRYPHNSGYIEPHQHNPSNIRVILNVYLSKKGIDFDSGGVFFFRRKIKQEIEKYYDVNIGDSVIFFSTLKHSVDTIKVTRKNKYFNNPFMKGRWWIGLYSPESDLVKDRKTSRPTK